jgi:cell fate regulator YaaT (PSP1 superfamily)
LEKNQFISRGCRCAPQPNNARQEEMHAHSCTKLNVFNWLDNIETPDSFPSFDVVEVRFKNSRKDFFRQPDDVKLMEGDIVAVEASPGHDIGIVTCVGEIVRLQIKNKKPDSNINDFKKVYRRAKASDIEKWITAVEQEEQTMFNTRQIASSLKLEMKISDVEYQGDKTKAIFYYTADERVDFRELIKLLAERFNVRIEMRQIGMRQEASRLGGIGSCGRELCCSTWLTNFRSVSTTAARTQQLSLNPQKLAGQCSKLKCCINYENDCYLDALKDQPNTEILLETKKGKAFHQKTDVLRNIMWYSYKDNPSHFVSLTSERVKKIQELNKKRIYPEELLEESSPTANSSEAIKVTSGYEEDSLTRFDNPSKTSKKKKKNKKKKKPGTSENSQS